MIEEEGYEEASYEQEPVAEPAAQAQPEIDISRYVQPLQEQIADLTQRLDPERNAQIFRQQQVAQAHRRQLEELRLSGESGDVDRGWKAVPQILTTYDSAIGHLYQQVRDANAWREEAEQRQSLEIEAMNEERFFAARDPEGHGLIQEYPVHVARAIAASRGETLSRAHMDAATAHMESRFGALPIQQALDEMAGYVRQVKGSQVQKPARKFPTAVPTVHPSRNSEAPQVDQAHEYARSIWA